MPDSFISLREYAKRRGVSAMAVSVAVKTGRLKDSVTRNEHGQPKISDPDLADREWDANTNHEMRARAMGLDALEQKSEAPEGGAPSTKALLEAPPSPADAPGEESLASAAARSKHWEAQLRELKYREAAGELVPAADVAHEWAGILSQVRTKMLGLPTQIKQAIPSLAVVDTVLIEDLIRTALEDLVADMQ